MILQLQREMPCRHITDIEEMVPHDYDGNPVEARAGNPYDDDRYTAALTIMIETLLACARHEFSCWQLSPMYPDRLPFDSKQNLDVYMNQY